MSMMWDSVDMQQIRGEAHLVGLLRFDVGTSTLRT